MISITKKNINHKSSICEKWAEQYFSRMWDIRSQKLALRHHNLFKLWEKQVPAWMERKAKLHFQRNRISRESWKGVDGGDSFDIFPLISCTQVLWKLDFLMNPSLAQTFPYFQLLITTISYLRKNERSIIHACNPQSFTDRSEFAKIFIGRDLTAGVSHWDHIPFLWRDCD